MVLVSLANDISEAEVMALIDKAFKGVGVPIATLMSRKGVIDPAFAAKVVRNAWRGVP
jgi:hypothetical protein